MSTSLASKSWASGFAISRIRTTPLRTSDVSNRLDQFDEAKPQFELAARLATGSEIAIWRRRRKICSKVTSTAQSVPRVKA